MLLVTEIRMTKNIGRLTPILKSKEKKKKMQSKDQLSWMLCLAHGSHAILVAHVCDDTKKEKSEPFFGRV